MASSALSRKEKRKLERNEKKQRKSKKLRVESALPVAKSASKSGHDKPRNGPSRKRPPHASTSRSSSQSGGGFQNRFHELVQETTGRSMRGEKQELSREDAEIKALEKHLGLGSKKDGLKRLQREYVKDGLGEDFTDFLSTLDRISSVVKERKKATGATAEEEEEEEEEEDMDELPSDMEMDEETRREFALLQQEDAAFLRGMDELPTDESDLDSDEDLAAFQSDEEDGDEEDEQVRRNTLKNVAATADEEGAEEFAEEEAESEVDGSEPEEEEEEEEEDKPVEVEEDIYGRPVLKNADGVARPSAYVPPHLRRQMMQDDSTTKSTATPQHVSSSMDEQGLRDLARRVNGQLNRISETNMESISLEMEKLYRECGRATVNGVLLDKLVHTSVHPGLVLTPLVKVSGALVAALHHSVGSEVGGFFLEKFVLRLVESVDAAKAKGRDQEEGEDDAASSKEPVNLLLLVAMLYNFGVVQCTLIYDLFRRFVDQFSPVEIELIHHLLRACGHQLRADDSDALKEMVAAVQLKVATLPTSTAADDRVRFVLDLIYDLKKPTKQLKKQQHAAHAALDLTALKKWLGRVKSRCGNANQALRVSLHEILHAEQDGRWWIVGGTWVGFQQQTQQQQTTKGRAEADDDEAQSRLLRLAEKQRMNTDVRKRIFVAIMGASDCLDAYERLLQLHLKEKQEREIVRVVLHCCGHETQFNRYYLVLSLKLCEMDPRYKFTFQLAFWDTFKQLESLSPRRLLHAAQLLAGLIMGGALSLSCLKVIDFTAVGDKTALFLKLVLEVIMKMDDEMEMAQIFQRLLQTKKAQLTIDGLAVFMHQHVTSFKSEPDADVRKTLRQRSKTVKSLLDALAKSAAATESMRDLM
jgi:nucleolar MIF4G domain-containing protein 1